MILMPLFFIKLPANAAVMYNIIMQIVSFELIDLQEFLGQFVELPTTEPLSINFEQVGMESTWFILNMNSLWLIIIVQPLLTPLLALIYCLRVIAKSVKIKRIYQKLKTYVFWNYPITFMQESYAIMAICAQINILRPSFDSSGGSLSTVLAYTTGTILLLYPAFLCSLLNRNQMNLN